MKLVAALRAELQPILCVGESEEEREEGVTEDVLRRQLEADLEQVEDSQLPLNRDRLRAGVGDRDRQDRVARAGRGSDRVRPFRRRRARCRCGRADSDPLRRLGQARQRRGASSAARRSTAHSSAARASSPLTSSRSAKRPLSLPAGPDERACAGGRARDPRRLGHRAGRTRATPISQADTPVFDELWAEYAHTQLSASGRDVGLPDGQMGNSEVGHLNLGAGAVVKQDLARIDDAIADGSFFENEALLAACEAARELAAGPSPPDGPGLRRRRPLGLGAHRGR